MSRFTFRAAQIMRAAIVLVIGALLLWLILIVAYVAMAIGAVVLLVIIVWSVAMGSMRMDDAIDALKSNNWREGQCDDE